MYYLVLILIFPPLVYADWFQTTDQQAFQSFQQQHFDEAAQLFNDPYQQGVSWYRAGKYAEAEKAFSQVTRPEKQADAQYNLGNTFYQQKQFDKAVSAYQNAQRLGKNDADVMHNLQLAKKQVQQQQSQQNQGDNSQKKEQNQQDKSSKDSQQKSQNSNSAQNSEKSQSDNSQQNSSEDSQHSKRPDTAQNSQSQPNSSQPPPEPPKNSNSATKSQENQPTDEQMAKNSAATPSDQPTPQGKAASGKAGESSQNQKDMLADAWLDQVAEDSEQLLKNQFKIDKWLAEQQRVAPPKQDW